MNGIAENAQLELISDHAAPLQSGIVVFRHKSRDNAELFQTLQSKGVVCALRGQGIRLSPHFYHTEEELTRMIGILNDC